MRPYLCPICEGRGKVPKGFYPDNTEETTCRTCKGDGVLWGESRVVPALGASPFAPECGPSLTTTRVGKIN